jgi:deoxyribonuclease-4
MEIGHHVFTIHGFATCASYAKNNDADIIQIFLRPPQNFKITPTKRENLDSLRESASKLKVKILIHGSFLVNLCKMSSDIALQNGIASVIQDLNESVILSALGVVIHMGHNTSGISDKEAFDNYVKHVKHILKNSVSTSTLILETGAGQGREIATHLWELGRIRDSLTKSEQKRVKFCIDTCHIYSAGYDLSDPDFVLILDKYIENTLGWKNVAVIHLNDSKCCVGSKKDRHADIGKGYICIDGIKCFIKLCVTKKIPMVLETPADEYNGNKFTAKDQIKMIRNFV